MRKNRSDAVHIMHSCEAFSKNGLQVELLTPKVERKLYEIQFSEIFDLYKMKPSFKITELPTKFLEDTDQKDSNWKIGFEKFKESFRFVLKHRKRFDYDIVYSKCFISTLPFLFLKRLKLIKSTFVFEAPYVKESWLHRFIVNHSDYIVVGTTRMENKLKANDKHVNKVIRTPLRYYINEEELHFNKKALRQKFKFHEDKKYVLYAGKAGVKSKELHYIMDAAEQLPEYEFAIVGITDGAKQKFAAKNLENLTLLPFQKLEDYDDLVRSADVLIAYYTNSEYNRYFLGPGKASAYFKSKNPVIFSDLPSLRDRYHDDMVYFIEPDNSELLTKTIKEVVENPELNKQKTESAKHHVLEHSFEKSTKKVLEEIERREQKK
ncbi:glycosyltransferase [Psychroserpens sp.]|uniref:glycosyltransferase n=1 Tax=Psychroserpens sp. TaxID=2020870 RepID=UPI003858BCB3